MMKRKLFLLKKAAFPTPSVLLCILSALPEMQFLMGLLKDGMLIMLLGSVCLLAKHMSPFRNPIQIMFHDGTYSYVLLMI